MVRANDPNGQQAQSDYVDFLDGYLNVHDLNSTSGGLRSGVAIKSVIDAFKRSGFSDSEIATEILMVMQTYSANARIEPGIGGRSSRQYQPAYFGKMKTYPIIWQEPEEFIDIGSGQIAPYAFTDRPDVIIGSENSLTIPCSPSLLKATLATLTAMKGTSPPVFWRTDPANPYTFTPDMAWLDSVIAESTWADNAPVNAANEYMMQGFDAVVEVLWGNPPPRDLGLTLSYAYELLSRFYGATALGANLTAQCIATAKQYKIEFQMAHMVSSTPIDPDSLAYCKANGNGYYTPIPFSRLSELACMLMLQGYPVFVPLGDPRGIGFQAPEGITGKPLIAPMDINGEFGNILYRQVVPARFAALAALNGNKRNIFVYPTADSIPAIQNPDGTTTPGTQTGTQYGSLILPWKNPDGTFALPVFADNSLWNDLEAAQKAGKCTAQQNYNLVDKGIAVDPVLNDLLFIEKDAGVSASWDASCKNAAFLRNLYLSMKPNQPAASA